MFYYVYIIQSLRNGYLYVGFTQNLPKRIHQHNQGYTYSIRNFRPFELIYYEAYRDKKDAIGREKYLKSGWGRRFIRKSLENYFENKLRASQTF